MILESNCSWSCEPPHTWGTQQTAFAERRLERAFTLLNDRRRLHLSVLDIAYAAGFGDVSYFNRMFRPRFGDTPFSVRAVANPVDCVQRSP
jgi:AraC-like DNA-binding protein